MAKVIVVEGLDYSGKSTSIKAMKHYLESKGKEVYVFGEPGSSDLGKRLKAIMVDPDITMDDTSRLLLLTAARNELLTTILPPILKNENAVILLDRFIPSFFAYADESDWKKMNQMIFLHPDIKVDLVLYLSITEETFRQRIFNSNRDTKIDGIERKILNNFSLYHKRFEKVFDFYPSVLIKIDANKDPDTVITNTLSAIKELTQ